MQPKQLVVASHHDGWFQFLAFSPVKLHLPLQCLRRWHNVRHRGFSCSSGNIGKFPFWSGQCLVGELSCRGPVHRVTIRRGTVYRGSVLGEVSVGEVSSRGNVLEPESMRSSDVLPFRPIRLTMIFLLINIYYK